MTGTDATDAAIALAWAGEEALLASETRHDAASIEALLDPEFREFGQSGRVWTREAIIEMLLADSPDTVDADWTIGDGSASVLAEDVVLLTYSLVFDVRHSRRSSIWRIRDGRASILFHQGTTVPPAS